MKRMLKSVLSLLMLSVLIAGCPTDQNKKVESQEQKENLTKVKVGDLRSEFWLPIYVAKEKGYFQEQGLDVELIMFKDGPVELQSALN